jgi:hypothetical protein
MQVAVRGVRDMMGRLGRCCRRRAGGGRRAGDRPCQPGRTGGDPRPLPAVLDPGGRRRLLPPGIDLDWLAVTADVLGSADTYLHISRTVGWPVDAHEEWLLSTWRRLLVPAEVA